MEIANGGPSFYSGRPLCALPVDNGRAMKTWLFRSYGRYTIRQETADEAFDAYRAVLEGDSNALLAYLPYGML